MQQAYIDNILPDNFLLPGSAMQFDLTNAINGLQGMPRALMLCGFSNIDSPQLPAGAAMKVTSEKQAIAIAGMNSILHQMYKALPTVVQYSLDVYLYRLDGSIGTPASQTFSISIDGDGVLINDVAVTLNANGYLIPIALTTGSNAADVATAVVAAITANSTFASMTATSSDASVTFTSSFGGTESSDMILCMRGLEKSLVKISTAVTDLTAGTGNQDLTTLFTYLDVVRITQVAWPGRTNDTVYSVVAGELLDRWGPATMRDTQWLEIMASLSSSDIATAAENRNCHQVVSFGIYQMVQSPIWQVAACAAGLIEYQAAIDPAIPLRLLELVGIDAPLDNFQKIERNNLLQDGVSTFVISGGALYIERVVTNYTKNAADVPDASFRNLEWIKTMSYWRWYVTTQFALKFQNYKLAQVYDDAYAGMRVMTVELAEETIIRFYRDFIDAGLMQDMAGYANDLQIEIAGASGRLKYKEKPRLVTQLFQEEITSEPILGSLS